MALSGVVGSMANAAVISSSSEDLINNSKKVRKPYTITKSRESWTEPEHDRFIEALQLFDRDWKKIEAFVGSKSVIQIRSHAQKYFLKVQKSGTSERVPPPRPKRKAAHPYPQKASLNDTPMPRNLATTATTSSWPYSSVQPVGAPHRLKDAGDPSVAVADNSFCGSCTESSNNTWPTWDITDQGSQIPSLCGMPDFVQVYNFIGSVFDSSTSGHLQQLKDMAPVDAETVLFLMRNLSINLTSPDFEDHRMLLSSYDLDAEEVKAVCSDDPSKADETANMSFRMKGA